MEEDFLNYSQTVMFRGTPCISTVDLRVGPIKLWNKKTVSGKPKLNDINSISTASNSLQWRTGIEHCKNCKQPFYFIKSSSW